jgi:hypothetical protein
VNDGPSPPPNRPPSLPASPEMPLIFLSPLSPFVKPLAAFDMPPSPPNLFARPAAAAPDPIAFNAVLA